MPSLSIPDRAAGLGKDRICAFLAARFRLCSVALVLVMMACGVGLDLRKKMWIDELYTLHMAQQASFGEIVKATLEGCDGAPPLYAMIVHVVLPWTHSDGLAVRLPSTLGFCGMAACLLAFCRQRFRALYAFVAAALGGTAALAYASEGRCYGLLLCGAAAALVCWQAACDGRRRGTAIAMLAVSLALMTALHYYSLFFVFCLLLAEAVRSMGRGKVDMAMAAAMIPAFAMLGLHWPLIEVGRRFQQNYWARATWGNLLDLWVFVAMLAPLGLLAALPASPQSASSQPPALTRPEWVAVGAVSLMPICVLMLSIYVTHIFVLRYVLWAEVGVAVLVAALLFAASRGQDGVGLAALCLLLVLLAFRESTSLTARPVLLEGQGILQALSALPASAEPIVVADHHVFMELSYYAPSSIRPRLIYPVSREMDLRYRGEDTGALLMSALSHRSQLSIANFDQVLAAHPHFVLAALPTDHLPVQLRRMGYAVEPIGSSAAGPLFQVDAPIQVSGRPTSER
jgi:hypothetical protein